jgi:lambda family phage minor tail protein L
MTELAIYQELQKSVTDAKVTLYVLDLTLIGGSIYRFTSENSNASLYFGGLEYVPMPINIEGIGVKSSEAPQRPTLTVSNINHTLSYVVNSLGDLVGGNLKRIRTFRKFLDDGIMPNGNAHLPIDEYLINQKLAHNKTSISFELASRLDFEFEKLPRRLMMRDDIGDQQGFPGLAVNSRFRNQ